MTIERILLRVVSAAVIAIVLALWGTEVAMATNGSVTYTYDALGRVSTASYDTGVIVMYSYDANGNRTQQVVNVNTASICYTDPPVVPCVTNCWGAGIWTMSTPC